jgi:hypothetical protein
MLSCLYKGLKKLVAYPMYLYTEIKENRILFLLFKSSLLIIQLGNKLDSIEVACEAIPFAQEFWKLSHPSLRGAFSDWGVLELHAW